MVYYEKQVKYGLGGRRVVSARAIVSLALALASKAQVVSVTKSTAIACLARTLGKI